MALICILIIDEIEDFFYILIGCILSVCVHLHPEYKLFAGYTHVSVNIPTHISVSIFISILHI